MQTRYVAPDGDDVSGDGFSAATAMATVGSALAALPFGVGVVELASGSYAMGVDDCIELDVSKVSLRCSGQAVLGWVDSPAAGHAVRLYCSTTFEQRYLNWRRALDGVVIRGSLYSPLAAVGLRIGHDTYDSNACFSIENGGVEGFSTGVAFGHNTWKIALRSFHVRGIDVATIDQVASPVNSGESLSFYDCMLEGMAGVKLTNGDWHFYACSFDNCPLIADGDADVYLHGCHVENPGDVAGGYRMLSCISPNSAITAFGTHFVFGGTSDFGWSPFSVHDGNLNHGLTLIGCLLPQSGSFKPELNETHRRWVAGSGRAIASGTHGTENSHAATFSASANRVGDGAAAWSGTTVPTVAPDGLAIAAGIGQSRMAYQEFAVMAGQKIAGGFWVKASKSGTGGVTSGINFYTRPGGPQVSWTYGWSNGVDAGSVHNVGVVVPAGASVARVFFEVWGGSSGSATLTFNDVVVNVI